MTYDGDVEKLQEKCTLMGFMAGVKIDDHTIMFAVTEQRTKEEIDDLVNSLNTTEEELLNRCPYEQTSYMETSHL